MPSISARFDAEWSRKLNVTDKIQYLINFLIVLNIRDYGMCPHPKEKNSGFNYYFCVVVSSEQSSEEISFNGLGCFFAWENSGRVDQLWCLTYAVIDFVAQSSPLTIPLFIVCKLQPIRKQKLAHLDQLKWKTSKHRKTKDSSEYPLFLTMVEKW